LAISGLCGKKSTANAPLTPVSVLQEFFENPAFRSDGLKLYPTLVIRGTGWSLFFVSSRPGHGTR
jgi:histone acetyltransferase (RNA polymerase elongator complex component)